MIAIVDDDDFIYLSQYKWHALKARNGFYAARNEKGKTILMHRLILNCPKTHEVDHKNMDRLDNRKENLRIATRSQNRNNQKLSKNNTTGFKGIYYNKKRKSWESFIKANNKHIYLGKFNSPQDAHDAYKCAAILYFGEFARVE